MIYIANFYEYVLHKILQENPPTRKSFAKSFKNSDLTVNRIINDDSNI